MTYFFDTNIAFPIILRLRAQGFDVIHHHEVFDDQSLDDEIILTRAAQEGWIFVTADRKIRTRTSQAAIALETQLEMLFLHRDFPRQRIAEQLLWFEERWKSIDRRYRNGQDRCCHITLQGKLEKAVFRDRLLAMS
jgi:uncharacterized protein with PIN domain